jgi:predicted HicB family RNase H-like nuclease
MLSYLIELEGYRARIERDREGVLWGRVLEISEPINFKSPTVRNVETRFAQALSAYFERCAALGKEPEKPQGSGF